MKVYYWLCVAMGTLGYLVAWSKAGVSAPAPAPSIWSVPATPLIHIDHPRIRQSTATPKNTGHRAQNVAPQQATPTRTPTPINVGNFVWDDLDGDGVQDAGEPGIAGVTVQLWNADQTQLLDTDTTNASGIYTLTAPQPGQYRVRVLLPTAGDQFSPKDNSGNDQTDSDINPTGASTGFTDIYTFGSNLISITTIDAGLMKVQPTSTPTPTGMPQPTAQPTAQPTFIPTPTNAFTPTATATIAPNDAQRKVYLPLVEH